LERTVAEPFATSARVWPHSFYRASMRQRGLSAVPATAVDTVQAFGAICIFSRAVRSRESWTDTAKNYPMNLSPVGDA